MHTQREREGGMCGGKAVGAHSQTIIPQKQKKEKRRKKAKRKPEESPGRVGRQRRNASGMQFALNLIIGKIA